MTVSLWQADGTQPVREVDFLIVGAGVVGCAAAYFAMQAGREVVITETRDVALGASSRNAGFMITGLDIYYHRAIERYGHAKVRELWALSQRTHHYWLGFAERGDVPLDRCGSMLLAESEAEARDLEEAAQLLSVDGIDVIFHPDDPLDRGYFAAIEQPNDCAVQPYRTGAGDPARQRRGTRSATTRSTPSSRPARRSSPSARASSPSRRATSCSAPTPIRRACIPTSSAR